MVASDGTAAFLESLGWRSRARRAHRDPGAARRTRQDPSPEHPRGILARRDHPDDLEALDELGIKPFDLVCVNLYPFTADRRPLRRARGGGGRDDRHRRAVDAPRGGEELAHVTPLCRPSATARSSPAARDRRGRARDAARARGRGVLGTAAYEAAIAAWFSDREAFPERFVPSFVKVAELPYGENPHQRAAYYAEAARGATCCRRRAAARQGAVVQQPHRPLGGPRADARVHAAGLRDRQAREPVRRRRRRHDRGGVRRRAGLRPGVGLRRGGRPQPADTGRARRASRSSSSRFCRARLRRGGARGAEASRRPGSSSTASGGGSTRASATSSASSAACSSGPGLGRRGPAGDGGGRRHPRRDRLGRPAVRWRVCKHVASNAIVLAQRPADARDRRGPDEPGRRGAARHREGARARHASRARRWRRTRSSPSPTGRGSPWTRRHGDHPAGRLEARRRGRATQSERPARRWSSPTAAISATKRVRHSR